MAKKNYHEFRDPIHNFIKLESSERQIIDSVPFQRLRHITQLATTYYVYPGATHKRFEHSVGVLELAGRIFDIITDDNNIKNDLVREIIPPREDLALWRKTLRVAALCHDLGHLPFSHAAEKELLPPGCNHETLTMEIIRSKHIKPILEQIHINTEDVVKIAVGQKIYKKTFDPWITILSEVITGDFFGADRIDYLLRDSHHIGVAYGKFDHHRLLNTLRILPKEEGSDVLTIGVEDGGIQAAEALQIARYFMYTQVYFHDIRRAYDLHLKEFLKSWLPGGLFSTDIEKHLLMTDNDVNQAIFQISLDKSHTSYKEASILFNRKHFKCIHKVNKTEYDLFIEPGEIIFNALSNRYSNNIKRDKYISTSSGALFPVITDENKILQSINISPILNELLPLFFDYIYVNPDIYNEVERWLKNNFEIIFLDAKKKIKEEEEKKVENKDKIIKSI